MKTIILALSLLLSVPAYSMSANQGNGGKYNAAKAGKAIQYEQARNNTNNTNPNSDRNCNYCYKDLSTQYNPSYKKYGKTQ
jgi:hypothetical protein